MIMPAVLMLHALIISRAYPFCKTSLFSISNNVRLYIEITFPILTNVTHKFTGDAY